MYVYPINAESPKRLVYTIALMNFLQQKYAPEVKAKGARFLWQFDWQQDYVGAGSNYIDVKKEFYILLFGGQIRATDSNFEVLATTLCHEFGHYLAGPPHQKFESNVNHWSSSEGQADWFAGQQCLPAVYDYFSLQGKNWLTFHNQSVTQKLCAQAKQPLKCQWILGAASVFTTHINRLYEKNRVQAALTKQDREVVSTTLYTQYPSLQCRLDTLKEATFCLDRSCERPRCWFKDL